MPNEYFLLSSSKPTTPAMNNNKGVVNGSSNGGTDLTSSLGGKACESCNGRSHKVNFMKISLEL